MQLRLGEYESALARLQKVVELNSGDPLGTRELIDVARELLQREHEPVPAEN